MIGLVFTSITFISFFLPLFLAVYYLIPEKHLRIRNAVILLFSIIFYGWGGLRYLGLLAASVTINYLAGLCLTFAKESRCRKAVVTAAIAMNLAILGVFKYAGFAASTLQKIGIAVPVFSPVLPIGISFYTFQGMSYVLDVNGGVSQPSRNPFKIALYISLFPQLVAGPIVRYADIEKELSERRHTVSDCSYGIMRFLFGFAKKLLLADAMGTIADRAFLRTGTELLSVPLAWIGSVAFALQIYLDFSSYSDMAIGLGRMAGFHFGENFREPYLSSSITEFWRKWHISLSSWFRDYVYIPLGGNRCGKARQMFNLMIVWTLTGLWHGANWTYLLWGFYYGLLLLFEKYILHERIGRIPIWIKHGVTLLTVLIGWVLFRSDTVHDAFVYLGAMVGLNGAGDFGEAVYVLREYTWELTASVVILFPWKEKLAAWLARHPDGHVQTAMQILTAVLAFALFFAAYVKLASGSFQPFIYFQF